MSKSKFPSIEYVRQCLRYEGGKLFWIERPRSHFNCDGAWKYWNSEFSGAEAGFLYNHRGRITWDVRIASQRISRYRLVWVLIHGEWAKGLDHKNRCTTDDRIENLRLATKSQNAANSNKRKVNTSGFKGVSWSKARKKWRASLMVNMRLVLASYHSDPKEAAEAYAKAAQEHFGDFACSE